MIQTTAQIVDLYNCDYLLWTEDIVNNLRAKDFDRLDLENLIEEIEDLGRSEKKQLKNRLATLLEHLLKRLYVDMAHEFNGWERTIREQRRRIKFELEDSPSLKAIWGKCFDSAWRFALETVREDYPEYQFPDTWQFSSDFETILNDVFWDG